MMISGDDEYIIGKALYRLDSPVKAEQSALEKFWAQVDAQEIYERRSTEESQLQYRRRNKEQSYAEAWEAIWSAERPFTVQLMSREWKQAQRGVGRWIQMAIQRGDSGLEERAQRLLAIMGILAQEGGAE